MATFTGRAGLTAALRATRLTLRFTERLRRPVRVVRVARIVSALTGPLLPTPPGFSPQCLAYFLRSTMYLSVRLLLRVFLPSVGKAQGVCG